MAASTDLWDRCLESLKKDLNRQSFETWFKPTQGSLSEKNTLKLLVPNEFFRDWIRDHYQPQIQKALKAVHPEQLEIQFEVDPAASATPTAASAPRTMKSSSITRSRLSDRGCGRPRGRDRGRGDRARACLACRARTAPGIPAPKPPCRACRGSRYAR